MPNCGPGAGSESCCTSLEVPGGTFYRTYEDSGICAKGEANPGDGEHLPAGQVPGNSGAVPPVRARRLAGCAGHSYTPPTGSGKHTHLNGGKGLVAVGGDAGVGYETGWLAPESHIAPTDDNLACPVWRWNEHGGRPWTHENLPITCVNWYEAYAFCIWDGGFLPSEAEWEYAEVGKRAAGVPFLSHTQGRDLAPVGSEPRGAVRWGQFDFNGEVYEWNLDWSAPYTACTDCAYLTDPSERVFRGGPCQFRGKRQSPHLRCGADVRETALGSGAPEAPRRATPPGPNSPARGVLRDRLGAPRAASRRVRPTGSGGVRRPARIKRASAESARVSARRTPSSVRLPASRRAARPGSGATGGSVLAISSSARRGSAQ